MKQDRLFLWVGLICLCAAGVSFGRADSVVNLAPDADTYLRSSLPDATAGGSDVVLLGVGQFGSPVNHGLFRFSLSSLPTNATITGATLYLVTVKGSRPAANHSLYRVLANWNENDATWNTRIAPSTLWAGGGGSAGSDYFSTSSATAVVDVPPATNNFSSASMVADVQLWLANPATNFGWIVIADGEEAGSGKQVGSRQTLDPISAPWLEITYTTPSGPPPLTLTVLAPTNNHFGFRFNTESNHGYAVEYKGAMDGTNWNVLVVLDPAPVSSSAVISDPFTTSNRFYRVRKN